MTLAAGQRLIVTGPDGLPHPARVLTTYRSTGGVVSVWIDLAEDYLANPANRAAAEWITPVLVLTERSAVYLDLWQERWDLKVVDACCPAQVELHQRQPLAGSVQ
jgi:hypothetical protein